MERLEHTRVTEQEYLDKEQAALEKNPNDAARREALEAQFKRSQLMMQIGQQRASERLLALFGERALARKHQLDLVVLGDAQGLGLPTVDLTTAAMGGPLEPVKPLEGAFQVRVADLDRVRMEHPAALRVDEQIDRQGSERETNPEPSG